MIGRAPANSSPAPAPPSVASTPLAERRQLTVLFCDLVGSTTLSVTLDPEDLREVISAYQETCTAVVARFGGFVARYLGDGVLAFFGHPQPHEDDAERAVRTGLALGEAVGQLATKLDTELRVRIGIATGVVVVGDHIGDGAAREQEVVGETPNLAARLQALAEPNTVLISESTRRLLGGLFDYRDLGSVALKGFARALPVWQVLGTSNVESRFEAQHEAGLTPLVGREEELDLLVRRWRQVQRGEGRVVLLFGEPGIGKSRIVRALQDRLRLADEVNAQPRYFCSAHHRDSALYPVMTQLERAAGFTRDDVPEKRLAKLEALLIQSAAPAEEISLIAAQLSIATGGRYPPLNLSPQRQKEKTLEALLAQLTRLAARNPVLLVYEDVHWIDPTSLEFLTVLVEQTQHLPVLLLVTSRPEFTPPWPAYAHVTTVPLTRLSRREGATLVARVTGGKALPAEMLEQILARTDGVPLFVEELAKTVLESGMLREEDGHYALSGPLRPLAIPTTLHASLMARLDRLAPVREVAQIGAAIGREFSYELLHAVSPMNEATLGDALNQIVGSELVYCRGAPPDAIYTFKHALVQDAAYDTLLRSRRHELHGRIAAALEERFPDVVDQRPEILAQHCTQAGLIERAIACWARAGRQSVARSAMAEAVVQLRKGIGLLSDLPDSIWRQEHELDLLISLGAALIATQGYAAQVTGEAYARARQVCEKLERPQQLISVLYGQWTHLVHRDELEQARQLAAEARRLGEASDDTSIRLMAYRISGVTCFFLGEFSQCCAHQEQGLLLFDATQRPSYAVADARVICLAFLSRSLLYLGHIDQAQSRIDEALDEARKLSHAYTLSWALWQACSVDWIVGSKQTLQDRTEALISLSAEQNFQYSKAVGTLFLGWSLSSRGQTEEAIVLLKQGLADYRATGTVGYLPFFLTLLADAYGKARRPKEGLNQLGEAVALIEATQERWVEAEVYRVRGELLAAVRQDAEAEASFRAAIAAAQRQGAKLWELRAATSLSGLWRDQGKRSAARDLLRPAYGWFTEGLGTPVLQDAKALLDDLR